MSSCLVRPGGRGRARKLQMECQGELASLFTTNAHIFFSSKAFTITYKCHSRKLRPLTQTPPSIGRQCGYRSLAHALIDEADNGVERGNVYARCRANTKIGSTSPVTCRHVDLACMLCTPHGLMSTGYRLPRRRCVCHCLARLVIKINTETVYNKVISDFQATSRPERWFQARTRNRSIAANIRTDLPAIEEPS
ncbi:hypothetical protein PoB_002928000 [Plakobranchus ocellatus]|uniref:Uncharacterized protein n=1 Tax=Plakobranchus ocellatus TaxID=259542 RepID=A0AAV4A7G7_9GAST|nr:hypothetical protein PoB_002928000 [Plakobranchus ocellatus]